ncbi:hypothetical protein CDAR_541001 [Caerostris darwini]|uniref:Uncharacterized protein n=1 Tax=Caerostris darwini TaxID=1538125 RepID=A0AAV4VJ86_9ARAC|nr:hypothetical protein CDAR_541001 [Caerostris darwini]
MVEVSPFLDASFDTYALLPMNSFVCQKQDETVKEVPGYSFFISREKPILASMEKGYISILEFNSKSGSSPCEQYYGVYNIRKIDSLGKTVDFLVENGI